MSREFKSSIMLFVTSIIWGLAFVAQSAGMEYLGPFTFTAARCFVSVIFLYLTYILFKKKSKTFREEKFDIKKTVQGGIACGILFTIGINLQQTGLIYTTAGKAGFLTVLYIVFIPIIGFFRGNKISKKIRFCIIFSMTGTYFLSVNGGFRINKGDIIIIFSAITFALHILSLSKYSRGTNTVLVSTIQFGVCGIISFAMAFFLEDISMENILKSYTTILYAGILSSGIGFTLQILALKDLDPVIASMISSLESVFGALFGWLILSQRMDKREIIGATIIFVSTLLAQIPIENYLKRRFE